MLRILFATLLLVAAASAIQAQDRYLCRNGHVWFHSHTPFEDIEAHNNEAAGVITPATGEMAFQLLNKSFKFERALMEEHFNENYMESDTYPKSDFKGKIVNLNEVNFSKDGVYPAVAEGNLTVHGKAKTIRVNGTIEVKGSKIFVKAKFDAVPQDYGIEIPGAVRDKFAKSMEVNVDMAFDPYKK